MDRMHLIVGMVVFVDFLFDEPGSTISGLKCYICLKVHKTKMNITPLMLDDMFLEQSLLETFSTSIAK